MSPRVNERVDWSTARLKPGDNVCSVCWQNFTSCEAFDQHRIGTHLYTLWEGLRMEPPHEDGRRCLDADEMTEQGFREVRGAVWTTAPQLGSPYRTRRKARSSDPRKVKTS